ncbi:Ankyrin repeat protein 1 [Giardia muris]|uniref:Ankyrin repeat protein 1 n=1 Tax=Giardia muris TaxID=5742 RepID=A0A4Z1T2X1_GIAMU|nr:Ankyrin repeat protein 1 [Giardia muris]|eukprot:TNJ27407.1 Ankyrin repeat protein 1 [Giardia muris]
MITAVSEWFAAVESDDIARVAANVTRCAGLRLFHPDRHAETALMLAVRSSKLPFIELLLPHERVLRNSAGETALMIAAQQNDLEAVKLLLKHEGCLRDYRGHTALMHGVRCGHLQVALQLVEVEGGMRTHGGESATSIALKREDLQMFSAMLDHEGLSLGQEALGILQKTCHGDFLEHYMVWASKKNDDGTELMARVMASELLSEGLVKRYGGARNSKGQTALIIATLLGKVSYVEILAQYEQGLQDASGMTALMHAARNGITKAIPFLLGEARCQDGAGKTALIYALTSHHNKLALELAPLEAGLQTKDGWTALMCCAKYGVLDVAKLLLPSEARLISQDKQTALSISMSFGHPELSRVLGPYEYDLPCFTGEPPYNGLLKLTWTDVAQEIADFVRNKHAGSFFGSKLIEAVNEGSFEDVLAHLDEAGRQDAFGTTALMFAAVRNRVDVVELLMEKESNLRDGLLWTALMYASRAGHPDVVEILKEKEAGARNNKGWTAMMNAARVGHRTIVKHLLPFEKLLASDAGVTALHTAAEHGYDGIVEDLLCEAGHQDIQGWTALMAAVHRRNPACIDRLLPLEARYQNKKGRTALMIASIQLEPQLVAKLAAHEAGMQDNEGMTALMLAVQAGRVRNVLLLYQQEGRLRNHEGYRAVDLARRGRNFKLAARLEGLESTLPRE